MFLSSLIILLTLSMSSSINSNYTKEDVELLANIMYLENGSTGKTEDENRQVLIATGSVVMNRIKSKEWGGTTIKDVLYAKGQYASATKNRIGKVEIPQHVYDLAEEILCYGTNVPDYVIFQSMQPKLGTVWKIIDGEYFATGGGHKMEGQDFVVDTNKKQYELEQKRLEQEFKKKIQEIVGKSYQNFSRLLAYKQAQQNKN